MDKISQILQTAQNRAREMNLSYAGAMLPDEAYQIMRNAPGAVMVDVRTRAELDWVGTIPDALAIEWATYPDMKNNAQFIAQLEQQADKDALLMFICRSGARSHNAAMVATQAGYTACYNVLEGFEGDKDASDHRNVLNGWRVRGLPWEQG